MRSYLFRWSIPISRTDNHLVQLLRNKVVLNARSNRTLTDKPYIIMDLRNFVSWVALLKVTQVFESMARCEVLEIRGADPDTRQDLFKILPEYTYEVLTVDDQEDAGGSGHVRIRKCA